MNSGELFYKDSFFIYLEINWIARRSNFVIQKDCFLLRNASELKPIFNTTDNCWIKIPKMQAKP